jgi:hypothetical protein
MMGRYTQDELNEQELQEARAEIERLRRLVREAHAEGYSTAYRDGVARMWSAAWLNSAAKKALEGGK